MSDLDPDRFHQVTDGQVPHTACHDVADQCTSCLLALEGTDGRRQWRRLGRGPVPVPCGPTWNRLVLLKNMKLILDVDESSASVRAAPDSSEAGRVTWASGSLRSSKWICGGGRRASGGPGAD